MITLLAFAAGHILVGIVVGTFLYLLRQEPPLAARRAAVLELTHRPARLDAGRAELARTRADQTAVTRDLTRDRQRLADWLPLDDTPGGAWKFGIVAGLLAELEAILFLLYSISSGFGNAPSWLLAIIAPPAAVTTVLLMHVMLAAAFGSRHRPSRTLRRARAGSVLGTLAVIMAIWAVLGGRNLTDPKAIETLTGLGLIMLASTTSLAGGFAALVATTLLEERRLDRGVARLEARAQALDDHYALIAADLDRLGNNSPEPPSGGFAVPTSIVPTVLLALLLGTVVSASAESSEVATNFSRSGACELLLDLTTSVNPLARQRALFQTREELPTMVDALGCTIVRIVPFSGDLLLDLTEIALPAVVDPAVTCREAAAAPMSGVMRTTALLYPTVSAARDREARTTCETQLTPQRQQQLAAHQQALAHAAAALEQTAQLTPRGNCTALTLAVQRALQRAQHVVVITDGENSCPTPTTSTALGGTTTLLFLLVPSNHDSPDGPQALLTRLAALQAAFPRSRALLLPELTPSFWRRPVQ